MDNKQTVSWGTIFSVASVAFGIHVGGGFATGNQTVNFFVKYGWTAIIFPIIAVLLMNLVFRSGLLSAQLNQAANYREWADGAYYPIHRVMGLVYEICYIVIVIMAVSTSVAGAGSLLETYGIPYLAGIVIAGAVFLLITIFGKELLAKASSFMTVCIVICMLILCVVGLTLPGGDLGAAAEVSNAPLGVGAAVWGMLQYVGYQAYTAATLSPYASTLKNKSGVNRMVCVNFLINGAMLFLSTMMLMRWYPQIQGNTLPILTIATMSGHSWLQYAYSLVLFFAFVSTGAGCTFGLVARFEHKVLPNMTLSLRRGIISAVSIVASVLMSTVGLTTLVAKGYGYLGIVGIFLMILPCLTIVWYRNAKGTVTRALPKEQASEDQ